MKNELLQLNEYDSNILENTESYNTSSKYIQIPTTQIIAEMQKEHDFKVIDFGRANVQKQEKHGKQKHLVMLQAPGSEMSDGTNLRIVIYNSSDRSSSIKLFAGAIRWACSNNLVFSEHGGTVDPSVSIYHTNHDWKNIIGSFMQNYNEMHIETNKMIETMQNRYMSYGDIGRFAERVAEEIVNPVITGSLVDPLEMAVAQRKEDVGKDLWKVYNRAQEHILQGGLTRIIDKTDDNGILFESISSTHKVTDTTKQIKMNRQIHELALEML